MITANGLDATPRMGDYRLLIEGQTCYEVRFFDDAEVGAAIRDAAVAAGCHAELHGWDDVAGAYCAEVIDA